MRLGFNRLKKGSDGVQAAFAAERSARNRASRRAREVESHAKAAASRQRRRGAQEDREVARAARRKVRVQVPQADRPGGRQRTPRKLFYRLAAQAFGTTSMTTARGPDGRHSVHFAFVARGFASTKGRRWRDGEGERAVLYIVREDGLERGELGWFSNIGVDRNELTAFCRASEALERHDRSNANVYCSEVISLPAELSARQRRRLAKRLCKRFTKRGLPFVAAIHLPDPNGDQRNYHLHIIYSLRPCERVAPYDWSFAVGKVADVNTPEGIRARRAEVVSIINTSLAAAHIDKRYTHLSNQARGMGPAQPKDGQNATWVLRRLAAAEQAAATLERLGNAVATIRHGVENARIGVIGIKNALFYRLLDRSHEASEVIDRLAAQAPLLEAAGAEAYAREAARGASRSQVDALRAGVTMRDDRSLAPARSAVIGALCGAAALVDECQSRSASVMASARGDLIEHLATALPSPNHARTQELAEAGARAEKRDRLERAATTLSAAVRRIADVSTLADVVRAQVKRQSTEIEAVLARHNLVLEAEARKHDKLLTAFAEKRAKPSERRRFMGGPDPDKTATDADTDAVAEIVATPAQSPAAPIAPPAAVRRKRKGPLAEMLRGALNERTPERDLQSKTVAGADATREQQDRAAESRRLALEEANLREPQVVAVLRAKAWSRLAAVGAVVTLQHDGSYDVDDASLLDDERRALRDPAHVAVTQERLVSIHAAQQAAAEPQMAKLNSPNPIADVGTWSLAQQAEFIRKSRGPQK